MWLWHRFFHKKKDSEKEKNLVHDLEVFEKRVRRLKEIERELYQLNTKGYEKEFNSILSKLRDVHKIYEVEEEFRALKLRIKESGVDEPAGPVDPIDNLDRLRGRFDKKGRKKG